ncbi:GIN domain-containing protein [Algibacter pacificus]|uniref:GIN domain-containing protein n=1 Tax=Algibacter pacificus TaxID=2599389 RepID=UPI0011CBA84D|nr:DUF2807 domain-containing protein [Algibacter pacificus]
MKKQLSLLILAISFVFFGHSQSSEKVKGNRNVTIEQALINPFHTIIVDETFEIDLVQGQEPTVEIETDENLHEFINFDVRDSVLSFDFTKRITSKKRLNIKVTYDRFLNTIDARDDAELHGLSTINADNTTLVTSGDSKVGLTIKTDHFNFEGLDKSKTELNLTANTSNLVLNGNSKLEALINSPVLKTDLYQKAHAEIEGSTDDLTLRTDNNSEFTGKNLTAKHCTLIAEIASEATIEVTDTLSIDASGSSSVYIYSNPKIIVENFANTSKIQKKEK